MNRRRFLIYCGVALSHNRVLAAARMTLTPDVRRLHLFHPQSGEQFDATYYTAEQGYLPDELQALSHLLRDRHSGQVYPIAAQLLDLLWALHGVLEVPEAMHILCGYRDPRTNARLVRQGLGAAKHSYHMQGQAVDIVVPGCKLNALRKTAAGLRMGGVGYYPRRGFVHIDVGPQREWTSLRK